MSTFVDIKINEVFFEESIGEYLIKCSDIDSLVYDMDTKSVYIHDAKTITYQLPLHIEVLTLDECQ